MSDLTFSIDVTANSPSIGPVSAPGVSSTRDSQLASRNSKDGRRIARKWEAATTHRLNEAHWSQASGNPVDIDLHEQLPELVRRTRHEYHNNPHVEGCVTTHAVDVVGPTGPILECQSSSDRFNDRFERFWREWTELADYTGRSGLPEMLQTWVRQIWTHGNWTAQEVTANRLVPGYDFPASLRLHDADPTRLETPWDMLADRRVAFGIRQTDDGIPTTYYFAKPRYFGAYRIETGDFDAIPADLIYHGYIRHEAEQSIGYPLLASCLDTIQALRDYDQHVLDAADMAASRSEWFINLNPDGAKFEPEERIDEPVGFSVPERRRVTRAAPPGWDVKGGDATHPTAEYVGHRKERMAEIGRAAAMPLMLIRLDSSQHNYSSARFDRENYVRHIATWQSWIGRRFLNRLARKVARELQLAGELRALPRDTVFRWNWPPPPQVDPTKARGEEKLGLANKTLTFAEACRRQDTDEEAVLRSWLRTFRRMREIGYSEDEAQAFANSWNLGSAGGRSSLPNNARAASETPTGATGVPNAAR